MRRRPGRRGAACVSPTRLAHAAISVRRVAVSFTRMCSTCAATVLGETVSSRAISAFVWPAATRRATSNSRAVSGAQRSACGARPRASRSSAIARSASGRLSSESAIDRTSARSPSASWERRARRWQAARSSGPSVPSHVRRTSSQPRIASWRCVRARPVSPLASATRPSAWSTAGRSRPTAAVRETTPPTPSTQPPPPGTPLAARRARVPVTRNGARSAASDTAAEATASRSVSSTASLGPAGEQGDLGQAPQRQRHAEDVAGPLAEGQRLAAAAARPRRGALARARRSRGRSGR